MAHDGRGGRRLRYPVSLGNVAHDATEVASALDSTQGARSSPWRVPVRRSTAPGIRNVAHDATEVAVARAVLTRYRPIPGGITRELYHQRFNGGSRESCITNGSTQKARQAHEKPGPTRKVKAEGLFTVNRCVK